MKKIVITGAAGFVGSHILEYIFKYYSPKEIHVIDKMTYSANRNFINNFCDKHKSIYFHEYDIIDYEKNRVILDKADLVIHAAAESHVDNSFHNSLIFTNSNTLGTHSLLEAAVSASVKEFIHISTDEVYGENNTDSPFDEECNFNPTNPYSASKAAAEMFVLSYSKAYKLPTKIIRANNMYGIRQFPEKLIPKTILRLKNGLPAIIHGDGSNRRSFLAVDDFCRALITIINKGSLNNSYNIASKEEFKNIDVILKICQVMKINFDDNHIFIKDRPHNDSRYLIDCDKLLNLGWNQKFDFHSNLNVVIDWYIKTNIYNNLIIEGL